MSDYDPTTMLTTNYEQIQLPIYAVAPRYEIPYDVLAHGLLNTNFAFSLFLDSPAIRSVSIMADSMTLKGFNLTHLH